MKRISAYIEIEVFDSVTDMAKRDDRSFNAMISILLHQAIKERNRKRIAKEKIHSPSHPANVV